MDLVKSILEDDQKKADLSKSTKVHKDVELEIDLGTLLASDYNVLDAKTLKSQSDLYLKNLTRDNVQLLVNKIWELPIERVDEAVVASLPKPTYLLPRSRVIPKPKPLTKWQQFAKEKGIQTKKKGRSKLKWDEELKKWIPTYGYKRAKTQEQKEWLIEAKDNDNPTDDPFTKAKTAKQERQSKNELQRLRNIARAKKVKLPKVGLPTVAKEHFPNSQQLSEALTIARTSTASVGKFQSRLPKEKDAKGIAKEVSGIKRKRKAPPLNTTEEKRRNQGLVDNVLKSSTKILRDDYSTGVAEIKQSTTRGSKKRKGALKNNKNKTAKKPKAGKGKRDLHKKIGGRKRR
ncbi:ribosome biogenesis regulatory protein homolog [Monomorium pharaonis]|uniref:ribosome biogenesis regulatory protein homolog n=1 Tax=Monomorium pharaonis TaxID=307658 RepID=UPI00063F47B5|nr:ribosome biogenesis regulatory protein homolog [Monomorium pharaonis]XP_036141804.1 ribosome biogenesis regulatory protein homolog [Monomorium pharaonis]